jgi:hypothetical protein
MESAVQPDGEGFEGGRVPRALGDGKKKQTEGKRGNKSGVGGG